MKSILKRLVNLETRQPTPEDEEKRRLEEFISTCTDDELYRLIAITEMGEMSPEDEVFWSELVGRYAAECSERRIDDLEKRSKPMELRWTDASEDLVPGEQVIRLRWYDEGKP